MTQNNLEKIILEKIKEKKITPRSKSFFFLRNLALWFFTTVFIFIGGAVFSILLYKISGNLSVLEYIVESYLGNTFTLYFLPYIWLMVLTLFLTISLFIFRKTDLAYRYNTISIIFFMFMSIMIFGTAIFYIGVSRKADLFTERYLFFYNNHQKIQEIKKNIFIKKLAGVGITEDILTNNPEIQALVYQKFAKNVLGKTYLFNSTGECKKESIVCGSGDIFFQDKVGCGCREVYVKIN